ncbi:retinol dehydrogenase 16 isoform X2 [Galendromus occidentalis]|nr:retinol dehydrogenase 16 isoform X2 [Galendromus occidentalis]
MVAVRLLTWTVCAIAVVYLSSHDSVVHCAWNMTQGYHLPAWLVLLPVSLAVSWIVAQIALYFIEIPRVSPQGKCIFITGCDSGFGHRLADRMALQGYKVFAGCLFPDGEGAQQLRESGCPDSEGEGGVTIVPCDVTSDKSLADAVDLVKKNMTEQQVLWAAVANAGIGSYGYLEWTTPEKVKKLFEVNVFGAMRTFTAFAPLLRKSKGRFLITNSFASRFSPPTLIPYSMSKHAALAMCDGLRAEMAPFGVHVASIEPNMYRTSIVPLTTKELDIQWESLTEEQRQSYGPKLLKKARIMTQDFSYLCQNSLRLPIWCFEHAITAKFPKDNYQADRTALLILDKIVLGLPDEFKALFHNYIHCLLIAARNLLPGRYMP